MSSKNDQVFQLSLTEIWIILCFILLLLMGYKVWQLTHKNTEMANKIAAYLRIPRPSGHLFHKHPATDSTMIRPPIPRSSGHP